MWGQISVVNSIFQQNWQTAETCRDPIPDEHQHIRTHSWKERHISVSLLQIRMIKNREFFLVGFFSFLWIYKIHEKNTHVYIRLFLLNFSRITVKRVRVVAVHIVLIFNWLDRFYWEEELCIKMLKKILILHSLVNNSLRL